MFVAIREIRAAWGRFGLMVLVVTMISLLLVMLTALTQGLGHQSTSAVEALPADRVVLTSTGGVTSFEESTVTAAQRRTWTTRTTSVEPLAVGHARAAKGDSAATVALFGLGDDLAAGTVALPRDTADTLNAAVGDTVSLDGHSLKVARVDDTQWYSHSPVAYVSMPTYTTVGRLPGGSIGTALLVHEHGTVDVGALDRAAGTTSLAASGAVSALPGYQSEHGSLLLIQAFLYGISALVVIAFVSVWTIQRTRDIAVLRALGASRRYVLRDCLGQAAALLAAGAFVGTAAGAALVLMISRGGSAVPIHADTLTLLGPGAGVVALGLIGSYAAARRATHVDPLLALGGN